MHDRDLKPARKPAAVTQDAMSWQTGHDDALAGRPPRPRDQVSDPLAYAAGRVEGEAERLRRQR